MDKHEEFKRLYKKFIEGLRWLNKKMQEGTATDKDKEEFKHRVAEPMDALWATFTTEEKEYWIKVKYVVDLFDGTIVLDDEENKSKVIETKNRRKNKRWKNYFRSY